MKRQNIRLDGKSTDKNKTMAAKKRRRGRPKKTLRDVQHDYSYAGQYVHIYHDWKAFITNQSSRFASIRAARGAANKYIASKFNLSVRQIQNIVNQGDALWRDAAVRSSNLGAELEKNHQTFQRQYRSVNKASLILQEAFYKDLLDGCLMVELSGKNGRTLSFPHAMTMFSSDPAATSTDSIQAFTAVLARAFLRLHELHIKENSSYIQRTSAK